MQRNLRIVSIAALLFAVGGLAGALSAGYLLQAPNLTAVQIVRELERSQQSQPAARAAIERRVLAGEIDRQRKHFDSGSKGWSVAYHFGFFASVALSGFAAALAKLTLGSKERSENLSAIFAAAAAFLIAVSASLGFERKWIANRTARAASYQLSLDLLDTALAPAAIRNKLKEIVATQSSQISTAK